MEAPKPAAAAVAVQWEIHICNPEDTLAGIALSRNVSIREIKTANKLWSDTLWPGQKLRVPRKKEGEPSGRCTGRLVETERCLWSTGERERVSTGKGPRKLVSSLVFFSPSGTDDLADVQWQAVERHASGTAVDPTARAV